MTKPLLLSLLMLGSAYAHAATVDLSYFKIAEGTGSATGNFVTMTAVADQEDDGAIHTGYKAFGGISVYNLHSFEYATSDSPTNFTAIIGPNFVALSTNSVTRYTFNSPYSGVLSFMIEKPAAGTATLSLLNFTTSAIAAVPEPETYALLMAGLAMTGFIARRQKKKEHLKFKFPAPQQLDQA
ncbi:PEP-CTERM sorting domain-containing protein [Xylophilus sp. GOD-11R]|uniref:PEP-CTERM sorting domain-containing protein n=1 Tax=Xylophilus sp. GOD-11R TaxID=3089814 RepID=UPI00298C858C|nr:PEP-CTERM sorting domain-containing protein [Xylophilus sp. GOD-11R]WPB55808.1 PEP-CTERM sorting domain-containing protein [Xylophilus sp. GOD-11R]